MPEELIAAVRAGDVDQVAALLDANPGLREAKGPNGVSVLMFAVYQGKPSIAALLMERGVALDIFEACAAGVSARVTELIATDPSLVNATSADGFHPLGLACFFGNESIARLLVDAGADVHVASSNAMRVQPIHAAAARRSTALVRLLLERGADPNARQHLGYVALHAAAQHGDTLTAEVLQASGADPKLKCDDGKTPADIAEAAGHADLAARLRQVG